MGGGQGNLHTMIDRMPVLSKLLEQNGALRSIKQAGQAIHDRLFPLGGGMTNTGPATPPATATNGTLLGTYLNQNATDNPVKRIGLGG